MRPLSATRLFAHDLLRRVVAADLAGGFTLREIAPIDASRLLPAFDRLLDVELVERVAVRVGVWHYRLTLAGLEAASATEPPKIRGERDEDDVPGPKQAKARRRKSKKPKG